MRIAILSIVYSKEYGVARVIDAQVPYLLAAGATVDIYTCSTHSDLWHPEVSLIRIPHSLRGLRQALIAGHYDVVMAHTHPFYHVLADISGHVKTLLYEHGTPPIERFPLKDQPERLRQIADMVDQVYPSVSQVVTISQYAAQYIGWPQAHIIYNGADHYLKNASAASVPSLSGPIRIFCVSRFGKAEQCYKGLDYLVRLQADLGPNYEIVLLGRGPQSERNDLRKQGIQVLDFEDDTQLVQQYLACDAFVSFSQWETFNLPLGEAGFFHKPALALRLGPHPEVTPFVFDQYETLRDYLRQSTRESLCRDGQAMFEHVNARFQWRKNGETLVQLVWKMVGSEHTQRPDWPWWCWRLYWRIRESVRRAIFAFKRHD